MMDWSKFLPEDNDVQFSKSADFEGCASYSFIHILEMLLKKQTGFFWEFSERFMAKVSDTQPWGNSLQNVVDAANNYGVCLTQYWPELTYSGKYENIDWATYYTTIPQRILKQSYRARASFYRLQATQVASALENAPLWTIVLANGTFHHAVAQISQTQFYDSYEIKVKNFSDGYPIISQYALNIKLQNMPNSYLFQLNKKDGTKEIAVALPAVDGPALIDKGLNMGLPIPTVNNDGKTVDWPNLPIKFIANE